VAMCIMWIAKSGRSIRISERAEAASPRSRVGQACGLLDPTEHKYSTVAKVIGGLGSDLGRVPGLDLISLDPRWEYVFGRTPLPRECTPSLAVAFDRHRSRGFVSNPTHWPVAEAKPLSHELKEKYRSIEGP